MINDLGELHGTDGATLLKAWEVAVSEGKRPLQRHSHIRFEISCILEGSGVYTARDDKVYPISKGDFFVFSSNEQHCITEVGKDGLRLINLHFEPRYFWGRSADSFSEQNINFCFQHGDRFENRIPAKSSAFISELFSQIIEELSKKPPEYALRIKSLLNFLIISLIRDFDYSSDTPPVSRDKFRSVRRAIKYIDQNLSEQQSLAEVAAVAGMSPNYFSSLFHAVSGITLWEYVNSRRIDMAIRCLNDDEQMNILDIALKCGFNNTANFNKTFKKVTGMTPKEYRAVGEQII